MNEVEAIQAGRQILGSLKQIKHDEILWAEAELLASECLMIPVRFWFITPHHQAYTPFRIGEIYTGLRGQKRIKLVDDVGRVWHYDYDKPIWLGVVRDG